MSAVYLFLLVFLGDSITKGWESSPLLPNGSVIVGKVSGTIADMSKMVDTVLTQKPKKIFIMVGINQIQDLKLTAKYQALIEKIRAGSPETQIYVQSVLPTRRDELNPHVYRVNTELRLLCHHMMDPKVLFLDFHLFFLDNSNRLSQNFTVDGVHLTKNGYTLWRKLLDPYLGPDVVDMHKY